MNAKMDVGFSVKSSLQMWKTYLEEVREEVRLGIGIFSEDEHLRCLLQECFDEGVRQPGLSIGIEARTG
jgi:hypothetical protein